MKKLVIIPAFNEEANIQRVVSGVRESCVEYDLVVINDCSTDHTGDVCRQKGIPVMNLPVNLGIGGCMQTGYRYASAEGYEIAVQIDGDGQHDPGEIAKMENLLVQNGADIVIGSRFIGKEGFQSSAARRVGIRYFSQLIRFFTGQTITDPTSGFRLCNRRIIELFAEEYPKDYPEPETVVALLRNGYYILETATIMRKREEGTSSIHSTRILYYMIKVTLSILFGVLRTTKVWNSRIK